MVAHFHMASGFPGWVDWLGDCRDERAHCLVEIQIFRCGKGRCADQRRCAQLLKNQAWAREMVARDPDFFLRNINGQSPAALWIGCADSRVPAEYTISAQP